MIDEDRTMQLFLYTSDDWAPQSHKQVVAVCEECGRYKIVEKRAARPLCTSCPKIGRYFSPETLLLKSNNMKGEKNPMYGRTGHLNPSFGTHRSEEQKAHLSMMWKGEKSPKFGIPLSSETKRKIGNATRGENNGNWKGGVTPVMKILRGSPAYKNWRSAVFERDNWTCQMCNVRGGNLQAHHIRPVRDHKNDLLSFDINNGITLCDRCHGTTKRREYDFVDRFDAIIGANE